MKKFISFLLISFLGSTLVNAQNTFVCAGVNDQITFGSQASVYIFGGLDCSANTAGTVEIPVGGKVYVAGQFNSSSSSFVLKNSGDNSSTGQLIIKDDVAATGTVTIERLFEDVDAPTLSFPFNGYTISDFEADLVGVGVASLPLNVISDGTCQANQGCSARYGSSIFFYNNDRRLNSHMTSDGNYGAGPGVFVPYLRYSMNDTSANNAYNPIDGIRNKFFNLTGVPQNQNFSVALENYTLDFWSKNYHSEFVKSTIVDPFIGGAFPGELPDYGQDLFILGNPYTSHLDLSTIGINEAVSGLVESDGMAFGNRLIGVATFNSGLIDDRGRVINSTVNFDATTTDGTGIFTAGSNNLIIRPHGDFWIKFNSATMNSPSESFVFSDGIKTFLTPAEVNYKSQGANPFPNARMARSNKSDLKTYQIVLSMADRVENKSLDVAYIYTNNTIESGVLSKYEIPYHGYDAPHIYTLEESPNGKAKYYGEGVQTPRLLINGVNRNFYQKAIPIGINTKSLDNLQIELTKMTENLVPVDAFTKSDVNFYFHDIKNDAYLDISKGFTYEIDDNGVVENRYEIYLSEKPLSLIGEASGFTTKVFEAEDNVVGISFDQNQFNGSIADVYIYNALGQVINVTKDVDTSLKIVNIPLPASKISEFFVVNIIAKNGVVVSQKIVL